MIDTTNLVDITEGYELDVRSSISGRGKIYFLLHIVQSGYGYHPASNGKGTLCSFFGLKRLGNDDEHSPLSSAEVKNGGATPTFPLCVFMTWSVTRYAQRLLYFAHVNMHCGLTTEFLML
jgi:hypothetical protein